MAAAAEMSQNIRDQFLQCKICLDGLKEPKTLPCLHTFCADCLHYYIEHNRIDRYKFACPICRRHIYIPKDGVDGFPDSFFVSSLNDIVSQPPTDTSGGGKCGICRFKDGDVTATTMCIECKIELCGECSEAHRDAKITEAHTLLSLTCDGGSGGVSRDNYCRVHRGETIKYYCETCNSAICLPCTFIDHKGHEIEEIGQVLEGFSREMEALVLQSEDNILQLQEVRTDVTELENELFMRKESIKTNIRRYGHDLIKRINEHERALVSEIDAFFDTVSVGRDRQKLERAIFRLERAHEFAKQLISEDTSPIAQLVHRAEAKENLEGALAYDLPNLMVHGEKLDRHVYFMPGVQNFDLGALLKCTVPGKSHSVTQLRPRLPSSKAMFLHRLRLDDTDSVTALTFLPCGDIVILVSGGQKVCVFDTRGKLKYRFGPDEDLLHPCDVTISHEGDIAIADCGLPGIKVFDIFGCMKLEFGGGESDVFALPVALTTDHLGRYLVCDQVKQRITIHRPCGELVQQFGITETTLPQSISFHDNQLFVCDAQSNVVAIYVYDNKELQFLARLATHSNTDSGSFLACTDICADRHGNLLIADAIDGKLHLFNRQGEMSNIVLSGQQLLRPTTVAISHGNILAVAQQGVLDLDAPSDSSRPNQVCIYRIIKADV